MTMLYGGAHHNETEHPMSTDYPYPQGWMAEYAAQADAAEKARVNYRRPTVYGHRSIGRPTPPNIPAVYTMPPTQPAHAIGDTIHTNLGADTVVDSRYVHNTQSWIYRLNRGGWVQANMIKETVNA